MKEWDVDLMRDLSDSKFMEEVYRQCKKYMLNEARQYTSDPQDQEDIVHSAVEKLLRHVPTLRRIKRSSLILYLKYTVRSIAVDQLRKQGGRPEYSVEEHDLERLDEIEAPGLEEYLLLRERLDHLKEIWPRLREEDRLLLEGKYIWGHTDKELAGLLGCKPDSIRMKLTRARRNAFGLLSKEGV